MSRFFDDLENQLHGAAQREIAGLDGAKVSRSWWRRPRAWALLAVGAVGLATPAIARVSGLWDPGVRPGPPARTVTVASGSLGATGFSCDRQGGPLATSLTDQPPSPQLTSIFGVLRRPYSSQDKLPALLDRRGLALAGVNPTAIRYVGTASGKRYFVVPNLGTHERPTPTRCLKRLTPAQRRRVLASQPRPTGAPQICLLSANGSGGCGGRPGELRRRGTTLSSGTADRQADVVSLVPDGVTAVTISYAQAKRTFAVHNNFYSYTVAASADQRPSRIVWHLADGSTRQVP